MTKTTCPIDSCKRDIRSGGLCDTHYRRKVRYGDPEFMHTVVCAHCDGEFKAHNPRTKYCSDPCKPHFRNKCVGCQAPIANRSKRCAKCHLDYARSRRSYQSTIQHPDVDCPICGESFTPRRSRKAWTRSCSKSCAMRLAIREGTHNLQDGKQVGRDKAKVERNYRKRRALLAGVKSEPYTREEILERDEGVCHICGTLVDTSVAWPDDMYPSVDHVIPISKGGPDTLENVRLAHLICNLRKSDRLDELLEVRK